MASQERSQRERALRRRVLAGDEAAWAALYEGAFAGLWAYVSWRCAGRPDLAEEVAQETWLVAVRRLRAFDPRRASFPAWLRGIAANVLRNRFHRQRRHAHQALDEQRLLAPPDPRAEQREQAELVARALAALPGRYEAVLRAKYLEQAGVEGIAADWGETPKAIESLLARARQALRTAYLRLAGDEALVRESEP
jgi:RNA polymerase sigma-70 factor (ECF subfamily)